MVIFIYFSFDQDSLLLLKIYIVLTPKYHIVLCCVESERWPRGNKEYLLFKVKGTAYVGIKSNSVITKNHFCPVVFHCYCCFPLVYSKWKPAMVFTTSSYSQYVFPSRIQLSPIADGLGMLFAMLPLLLHPSHSLTALCRCLSYKDWWTLELASFFCPCWAC